MIQTFELDNFCILFPARLPRLPILSERQGRLPEMGFQKLLPGQKVKYDFLIILLMLLIRYYLI